MSPRRSDVSTGVRSLARKTPRRETTRREMRDAEARGSMIRAWFE